MSKVEAAPTLSIGITNWGRLAANSTAHLTEHLFNAVIAVILPLMTTALGLSLAQAGALASARTLMAGVASFPSGLLADLARRRNLLLGLCLALIGLGTLGLALTSSFPVLLLFMALTGFGGGWFHPQSLAILSAKYRERKAFALGVHDSSANLGEVIGPLALAFLLQFFDWRTALMIWAIPGLMVGFGYVIWGAESESPSRRARDYRRAIWNDVLKNRSVCALVAVSTLRAMGQTALASFLPLFLSLHLSLPAAVAGAYMSILFLFAGIAPAFVGWISDRFGRRLLIMVFSFMSGLLVLSVPSLGSGVLLGIGLALLGGFLWALRPVIVSAAMSAAPQELSGSIVAFIYGANMCVSFLAPLLAGLIADTYGLPAAIMGIAFFPIAAALLTLSLLKERAAP